VPDEVPTTADRGWMHADFTWDMLDAPAFATRGTYARVSLISAREEFGASDNYTSVEGQALQAFTFGKKNTFLPRVSASVAIGPDRVPLYEEVGLGGFLNLSGLSRGKLYGHSSALAELIFYRKIAEMTPGLGRGLYAGFSAEVGEVWSHPNGFSGSDLTTAGSVFLGADTFLGALYLGAGLTDEGDKAVYLQMGSIFGQGRP
jgi:NTE family protein